MKFYAEIVQDFDGTYYCNLMVGGKDSSGVWHEPQDVKGLEEYVDYKTLLQSVKSVTGIQLPPRKGLKFSRFGRKKYAYVDATQYIPEGCGCCPDWDQAKRYPPKWD